MEISEAAASRAGHLVVGAITAITGAREAVTLLEGRKLPEDPLVRAALRAGIEDGLNAVRMLTHALVDLRDRLE